MRVAQWRWIGLLLVLTLQWNVTPTLSIAGYWLLIPFAALLGQRYGRSGQWMVAIGGLPLVVAWSWQSLYGGGRPDIYLVALCVSALADPKNDLAAWFSASSVAAFPQRLDARRWAAALAILPLYLGIFGHDFGSVHVDIDFAMLIVLYYIAFCLAVSRADTRMAMATLLVFFAFGLLLESLQLPEDARDLLGGPRAQIPLLGMTELRLFTWDYQLDSPSAFLTVAAYFLFGALCVRATQLKQSPLPALRSYCLVVLLTILAMGWELNSWIVSGFIPGDVPARWQFIGYTYALPCAALTAALLLRYAGVAVVLVLVLAFWLLDGVIRSHFDFTHPQILFTIQEPLLVTGFGSLGIALRNRLLGAKDAWWSTQWVSYALVLSATVATLFSWSSLSDFLWATVTLVAGLLAGKLIEFLRKRYLGWLPTHGGWVALLVLTALIFFGWRFRAAVMELAAQAWDWVGDSIDDIKEGELPGTADFEEIAAMLVLIAGLGVFLGALQVAIQRLPDCWRDIRSILRLWMKGPATGSPVDATPGLALRLVRALAWGVTGLRNMAIGLALVYLAAQLVLAFYPSEGLVKMASGWFASPAEPVASTGVPASADPDSSAAPRAEMNQYLLQSTREYLAQAKIDQFDTAYGTLHTDWYLRPSEPDIRRQYQVRVGKELTPESLDVTITRQNRRLGAIWVEQSTYWKHSAGAFVGSNTSAEAEQVKQVILARARELAGYSQGSR